MYTVHCFGYIDGEGKGAYIWGEGALISLLTGIDSSHANYHNLVLFTPSFPKFCLFLPALKQNLDSPLGGEQYTTG